MLMGKRLVAAATALLACGSVFAQAADAEQEDEMHRLQAEVAAAQHEIEREHESVQIEVEVRMREAEQRLAQAAQQMAELSMQRLPRMQQFQSFVRGGQGPVLGVTISSDNDSDPVEGVEILGVSPGGAAEEAGVRSGDVITSINDEQLMSENSQQANAVLVDFMKGIEQGDTLDIEYLRNGKSGTTEITPRPNDHNVFAFEFEDSDFAGPNMQFAPNVGGMNNFIVRSHVGGFGDMELVKLTDRLGSYFGTDDGLLVVRAPEDDELQLEDGDVIINIDGRSPTSVSHAMRILGSYESGEELKIEIMRDKRKRKITLEVPDNRQSSGQPGRVREVREKVVVVKKDGT
jgi:S1-C subfamily serine protease